MQNDPHPLPEDLPFEVRVCFAEDNPLPLAAARNCAAKAATGDILIFLDVDCVPSPSLVMAYAMELSETDGCLMGEVLYLPEGGTREADVFRLDEIGSRHPSKPKAPTTGLVPEPDYGELWGLSFALRRSTFERCGGLDERFTGYGGEETDFARTLEACGVPLYRCGGARAYHQYHAVYQPPLHHFDDIVRNAELFQKKWGDWPMDYWLGQFESQGLIARGEAGIDVLRRPEAAEVDAAKAPPGTLFS
ncbi:glycosyltransferase family 2 protein [Parvularcula dongshanensis]|nr:galactosyltransferase-related protein [Parvularcula dongshanensis]